MCFWRVFRESLDLSIWLDKYPTRNWPKIRPKIRPKIYHFYMCENVLFSMFLGMFLGNPLIYPYDWTSTQPETDQKHIKIIKNTSKIWHFLHVFDDILLYMFWDVFLGNPLIYPYDWTSTQPETDQNIPKYIKNTLFFTWFLKHTFLHVFRHVFRESLDLPIWLDKYPTRNWSKTPKNTSKTHQKYVIFYMFLTTFFWTCFWDVFLGNPLI